MASTVAALDDGLRLGAVYASTVELRDLVNEFFNGVENDDASARALALQIMAIRLLALRLEQALDSIAPALDLLIDG